MPDDKVDRDLKAAARIWSGAQADLESTAFTVGRVSSARAGQAGLGVQPQPPAPQPILRRGERAVEEPIHVQAADAPRGGQYRRGGGTPEASTGAKSEGRGSAASQGPRDAAAGEGADVYRVKAKAITLRAGPGIDGDAIGVLRRQDLLQVLERQDLWVKVRLVRPPSDGPDTGWVFGDSELIERF